MAGLEEDTAGRRRGWSGRFRARATGQREEEADEQGRKGS
jgi:hypothetical protein